MINHRKTTRRQFLQQTASASVGALSIPMFIPGTALGLNGAVAPSERIVMGSIGTGGQGTSLFDRFMKEKEVQVVALCDVDKSHLKKAVEKVNQKYGNSDCATYGDFRELIGHKGIDSVVVATPDHWHALASIAALNAGKDVYCEKPLANSVAEGRAICDAVKKNNRILQTGSHERSGRNARYVAELVRNGRIGKLHTIQINLPCSDGHHKQCRLVKDVPPPMPVPEGLDYNFWLGHTKEVPYTEKRCHFFWRFILDYGGGEMTDRGAHVIDLAQLCAGHDDTGPVEIEATGVQTKGSLYDVFWDYLFVNTYADGVKMVGTTAEPRGLRLIGDKGWIFIHVHGQKLESNPESLIKEKIADNEIKVGRSPGHLRNFLESVKSRKDPMASAEIGHRSASVCHLNNIAMKLGRKLKWNPEKEQFLNDDEANKLLSPVMRSPWKL